MQIRCNGLEFGYERTPSPEKPLDEQRREIRLVFQPVLYAQRKVFGSQVCEGAGAVEGIFAHGQIGIACIRVVDNLVKRDFNAAECIDDRGETALVHFHVMRDIDFGKVLNGANERRVA